MTCGGSHGRPATSTSGASVSFAATVGPSTAIGTRRRRARPGSSTSPSPTEKSAGRTDENLRSQTSDQMDNQRDPTGDDFMTVTEAATRTLEAPGATLTYDIRRGGSTDEPPLFLIGSPMGAAGFGTLASHIPDRTIITSDPRGAERSAPIGRAHVSTAATLSSRMPSPL